MVDATIAAALREYTAVFSAAMPPVLASETAVPASLTRPVPLSSTMTLSTPVHSFSRSSYKGDFAEYFFKGKPLFICSETTHRKSLIETSLLSRERSLKREFSQRCGANEVSLLLGRQRERERLLELTRTVEAERNKQTEERHERILARERELEEWRYEKLKEIEQERRRCIEEEERSRVRWHEREMLRIREEAQLRRKTQQSSEEQKKTIEKSLTSATESMITRLREELREHENYWSSHFEQLRMEYMGETAFFRQYIEDERQLFASGESRFLETRSQLNRLLLLVEELRRQSNNDVRGRTTDESLVKVYQKTIEQLQRAFEEDKQSTRQWFIEEHQRIQKGYELSLGEIENNFRARVQCLETSLEETRRRLRETETEAQELKTKLSSAAMLPASSSIEETRLREKLRTVRRQLSDAIEARERSERRCYEVERSCDDERKAQHALQIQVDALRSQHDTEMRILRDENKGLEDELARMKVTHVEELHQVRKSQRDSETGTLREATSVFDATVRRMREQHEEARRALEAEKMKLTCRLLEEEQRHKNTEMRFQSEMERAEEALRESDRYKQREQQQEQIIAEMKEMIEGFRQKEAELANLTSQNNALQKEKEELQVKQIDAVNKKEKEIQELRLRLTEAQQMVACLNDELSAAQSLRKETELLNKRLKEEAESKQKELSCAYDGEIQKKAQMWKESYVELKNKSTTLAPNMQAALKERDSELLRLRNIIETLTQDKNVMEKSMKEQQAAFRLSEQNLIDKTLTVQALTAEIALLRETISATTTTISQNSISFSQACSLQDNTAFTATNARKEPPRPDVVPVPRTAMHPPTALSVTPVPVPVAAPCAEASATKEPPRPDVVPVPRTAMHPPTALSVTPVPVPVPIVVPAVTSVNIGFVNKPFLE